MRVGLSAIDECSHVQHIHLAPTQIHQRLRTHILNLPDVRKIGREVELERFCIQTDGMWLSQRVFQQVRNLIELKLQTTQSKLGIYLTRIYKQYVPFNVVLDKQTIRADLDQIFTHKQFARLRTYVHRDNINARLTYLKCKRQISHQSA